MLLQKPMPLEGLLERDCGHGLVARPGLQPSVIQNLLLLHLEVVRSLR